MNNINKKIKILWKDARLFSPKNKIISLSNMQTTGILFNENKDYFFVKDPITINLETGKNHPDKNPTYYIIPQGMVSSVEVL